MDKNKRLKVSSISIQHFRGISDKRKITFTKHENIVVLLGENGTGKSSFVNAFEYLFKEGIDALDFQAKNKTKPLIHAGSDSEKLRINLCLNNQDLIKKEFDQSPSPSSKVGRRLLRNHGSFLNNASFILNRKKLLRFITAGDSDRYNSLMELCGLNDIDTIKKEFSSTKNYFNNKFKLKNQELTNSKDKLNKYLNCDGNYLENINKNLTSINRELINESTDLEEYLSTLDFQDKYDTANNLNKFNEIYQEIDINELESQLNSILIIYSNIKNNSLVNLQYSSKILENSQKYLKNTLLNECPVCGTSFDNKELILKIQNDLNEVNNLNSAFISWKNDVDKYLDKLNDLNSQFIEINNILKKLEIDNYLDDLTLINELKSLRNFEIFELEYDFNPIKEKLMLISQNIHEKDKLLSHDENHEKIKNLRIIINEFILHNQIKNELKNLELKRDLALNTLNSFNNAKKEYVNEVIKNIESDVHEYYEYLHDDDLISSPKINVIRDNSIKLMLESFGMESDPRQYSSEGHLDTLGLCIFLAFMKEYNPLNLIVLDDIITTVDFSHKYNVAKLLMEKFNDFNILITTHNGLWAQQLNDIAEATPKSKVRIEHIISWDLVTGPNIIPKKGYVSLIKQYLAAGESHAAVNTARQYLEYSMIQYCRNNPVNIKISDKYVLGDLYDAVKYSTINKDEKLDNLWAELDKNYFIVNKLSHYTYESYYIHSGEINQLCDLVIEICDNLIKTKR